MNISICRIFRVSANKQPKRDEMECFQMPSSLIDCICICSIPCRLRSTSLCPQEYMKQMRSCDQEYGLIFHTLILTHEILKTHCSHRLLDNEVAHALWRIVIAMPFCWMSPPRLAAWHVLYNITRRRRRVWCWIFCIQ